jgi:hypothetical protein
MDERVELFGQSRFEVVTPAFGIRPIDDADGALELRAAQRGGDAAIGKVDPEAAVCAVVKRTLVAAREAGPHALALRGRVPVGRRGDRAMKRREADREAVAAVALAHELADVDFAAASHLGRTGVSQMGVVRPYDHAVGRAGNAFTQRAERLGHMAIAHVPR